MGHSVYTTSSRLLSLPLCPSHSRCLEQTLSPALRSQTVGSEARLHIHKTLCNFVYRTFSFAGRISAHCQNYYLEDHSLSAVRDYSLKEFILRFSCTVCTFGRQDRECVTIQVAATKSDTNGKVYGLPGTACTLCT